MIEKTAIVGIGALGLLYADIITSAKGPDAVTFVMDDERLEKYRNRNFTFNGEKRVFHMEAAENAKPADLVIVAVKYNGLESAIDTMSTSVNPYALHRRGGHSPQDVGEVHDERGCQPGLCFL